MKHASTVGEEIITIHQLLTSLQDTKKTIIKYAKKV